MFVRIIARIKAEPAVLSGIVAAAISLAVAFGFNLSPEMQGGIMAATTAVLALFVRSQVSPVSSLPTDPVAG